MIDKARVNARYPGWQVRVLQLGKGGLIVEQGIQGQKATGLYQLTDDVKEFLEQQLRHEYSGQPSGINPAKKRRGRILPAINRGL